VTLTYVNFVRYRTFGLNAQLQAGLGAEGPTPFARGRDIGLSQGAARAIGPGTTNCRLSCYCHASRQPRSGRPSKTPATNAMRSRSDTLLAFIFVMMDVGAMDLDRSRVEAEIIRYGLVLGSGHEPLQDPSLAVGEDTQPLPDSGPFRFTPAFLAGPIEGGTDHRQQASSSNGFSRKSTAPAFMASSATATSPWPEQECQRTAHRLVVIDHMSYGVGHHPPPPQRLRVASIEKCLSGGTGIDPGSKQPWSSMIVYEIANAPALALGDEHECPPLGRRVSIFIPLLPSSVEGNVGRQTQTAPRRSRHANSVPVPKKATFFKLWSLRPPRRRGLRRPGPHLLSPLTCVNASQSLFQRSARRFTAQNVLHST
jgi:hypothetical protein